GGRGPGRRAGRPRQQGAARAGARAAGRGRRHRAREGRGGRPGHHRRRLAPPRTDRARLRPPQPLRAGHGARGGRGEGRGRLELAGALKIYTKTGDTGDTHLFGGARVGKDDPRVAAYGDVDELSALLGVVKTQAAEPALARLVGELQKDLFALGAQLADPTARVGAKRKK